MICHALRHEHPAPANMHRRPRLIVQPRLYSGPSGVASEDVFDIDGVSGVARLDNKIDAQGCEHRLDGGELRAVVFLSLTQSPVPDRVVCELGMSPAGAFADSLLAMSLKSSVIP